VTPISDDRSLLVEFIPATGFGNSWFSIFLNGVFQEAVYAAESKTSQAVITSENGKNFVAVLWTGEEQIRNQDNVVEETEQTGQKVSLEWDWPYEIIGNPDSELSNWALTGFTREWTESGTTSTRRQLQIEIAEDGGTATITGTRNQTEVFSGSAALGATATLTESNSSGISGSVDVGAAAADGTESLTLRLPASIGIYRDTSPSPTVSVGTVNYNDADSAIFTEGTALSAATYYYRLRATSDTADVGDYGTDSSIIVPGTPDAPDDLAYSSGDASATVLSFTASESVGATYSLYMATIGAGILDVQNAVATAGAGSTTITMPAVTGYAGTVRVLLRATLSDIEEKNGQELRIEYDAAGAYVAPRPNTPILDDAVITSGTTVTVAVSYDTTGEEGTAQDVQLFTRTPSGSYDFDTPEDTDTLAGSGTIKTGSLTTGLANGWHYITAMAATAAGLQSATEAQEQLVYVSDTNISSPTADIRLAGG
jgi:hypothetical protein